LETATSEADATAELLSHDPAQAPSRNGAMYASKNSGTDTADAELGRTIALNCREATLICEYHFTVYRRNLEGNSHLVMESMHPVKGSSVHQKVRTVIPQILNQ
jgi:hypothetical protein